MRTKFFILLAILSVSLYAKEASLVTLCKQGIQNNPKIRSFSHRVSASHSAYDQSIDQYKPHLDMSGQYGTQNYYYASSAGKTHYQGMNYNYQFTLKQPLFRAKLIEAISDAKAREQLTRLQEKDEKAKLMTQILQTSVELIRQKKTIDILKKKTELLEKAYGNILEKYRVKLVSSAKKFQAQAKLEQSRSDLIRSKQDYEYNLYNLRLLTKYKDVEKYIASLSFNIPAVSKAFKKANYWKIKQNIGHNTRIMLDRQSVRIAKIQIGLRNSDRAPNVDAVLSYGDSGGTIDYVTRRDDSRAMIQLSFPLYQGGYVSDRVTEAKYLYLSAQEELDNTRLNIKISMEKALQNIKGGIASIDAQRSAVEASKKYFEGAVDSYKNGMSSLTDTYLAESDYYDSRLRLVNSEGDVISSLVEMYYYGGKVNYKQIQKLQHKYFK